MKRIFYLLFILLITYSCSTARTDLDTSELTHPEISQYTVQPISADTLANIMLTLAEEQYTQATEALKSENFTLAKNIADDGMRYILDIPIFEVTDSFIISRYNINQRRLSSVTIQAQNGLWGFPVFETRDEILISINPEESQRLREAMAIYTGGGKTSLQTSLRRSGKYMLMIEDVLEDYDLPHDIAYLPVIESGYNPGALSPASASGIWQFIPSTGRNFGLKIDTYLDERRDPIKSTIAAARYLSSLYERFGDWRLAFAGYNCGEHTVERAINTAGTDDYWQLRLPSETMIYVPYALAVMLVSREPELYGLTVSYADPWVYDTIHITGAVKLDIIANSVGCTKDDLKSLNPHILQTFTHPEGENYVIRIPDGTREMFHINFDPLPESEKYLNQSQITTITTPVRPAVVWRTYTIRNGDNLTRIASRLGVTVEDLKRWNPNDASGRYLQIGATLRYRK